MLASIAVMCVPVASPVCAFVALRISSLPSVWLAAWAVGVLASESLASPVSINVASPTMALSSARVSMSVLARYDPKSEMSDSVIGSTVMTCPAMVM